MEAFFLPLGSGERFCLLHSPTNGEPGRGAVLFVHPFAEEMNKSRLMAAKQARALAADGWHVLQMDLFGCGDSNGDFGEATWQQWLDDVVNAAGWLQVRTGHKPVLWGLRLGCLIAVEAARSIESVFDLLLWQPVTSGKQFLQQFLRLKLAADLSVPSAERGGTQALRTQLERGEAIEVAGYTLSPDLALGLDAAKFELPAGQTRIVWLEISASENAKLMPASQHYIDAWSEAGHRLDGGAMHGAQFWQTVEISECVDLIGRTISGARRLFA
jgi:exosortase A-associated hydrolase 2